MSNSMAGNAQWWRRGRDGRPLPRRAGIAAAVVMLLAVSACAPEPPPFDAAAQAQVETEVRDAVTAWITRFNEGDAAAAVAFYANDPRFRWYAAGRRGYETRGEAARAVQEALARGDRDDLRITVTGIRVIPLAPDAAAAAIESTDAQGGAGVITLTLVKRDATWRAIAGHASATPPADPEDAQTP